MSRSICHKIRTAKRLFLERTYFYSDKKYPDSFLSKYTSPLPKDVRGKKIDRVIYVFWTGDNEMSENRKLCIEALRRNTCIPVKLITPQNLSEYILPEDPLPDCYQFLSNVHKADYLRAYFMHYYGGGYSDVKAQHNSWISSFDKLENSNAYVLGYHEICHDVVASTNDYETRLDLLKYWRTLVGTGAFICRPNTRFTSEWYTEMNKRVAESSEELRSHPAVDSRGTNKDYPIGWMHILGDIFHPLCLKYHKFIIQDSSICPDFKNYL